MSAAHQERLWFLRDWRMGGWRQNMRPGKKWDAHLAYLVKHGLLEEGPGAMSGMFRITDAGLTAIGEDGKS